MTDMYQTPGDRLRFEILLKSLTEGSLNLAVLSDHDQVLDFYGTLFEQRLRAKGETQIEFCASTNSEQLVQKFNEILSELTLNQALEKEAKHAPRRYLVFRDSILMQDFELQLLARLVNGFPAGNISVILLLKRSGSFRSKLDAFGKNLLQWEVEAKVGEVKEPLKDWVADTPDATPEALAAKLLKSTTKPSWRVPGADKPPQESAASAQTLAHTSSETAVKPMPSSSSSLASKTPPVGAASQDFAELPDFSREPVMTEFSNSNPSSSSPVGFEPETRRMPWGWFLLVALLSLLAFAYMYRDLVMNEVELMKKYLLRGTPAAPAPVDSASSAASLTTPALPMASQAATEATTAASAAGEIAPTPQAPASSPPLAASAATAAIEKPTPAAVNQAAVPASETKPSAAPTKAAAKTTEDTSDAAWLKQLPSNGYVVQLAAFDTEEEILAFKRANKLYEKARVLSPRKKGTTRRYFILVSGPFENKVDADAYMRTSPLLAKAWLRSSQSIQSQFDRP
jgi:hypothetical protein